MQEYKDGTFGEIKDASNFQKLFEDTAELEKTKAIHLGTHGELKSIRESGGFKNQTLKRLDRLELMMNEICVELGLRNDEVLRVGRMPRTKN